MLFTSIDGKPVMCPANSGPIQLSRVMGIRPRRSRLTSKLVPPASVTMAFSSAVSLLP
jgi:hypothetical protein